MPRAAKMPPRPDPLSDRQPERSSVEQNSKSQFHCKLQNHSTRPPGYITPNLSLSLSAFLLLIPLQKRPLFAPLMLPPCSLHISAISERRNQVVLLFKKLHCLSIQQAGRLARSVIVVFTSWCPLLRASDSLPTPHTCSLLNAV